MNGPTQTIIGKEIVALLCIGDAGEDAPAALAPLHGQPMLHHLIKLLETRGISRFFVGVDSVPRALLSYCDSARNSGLDIAFVRNPGDLAEKIDDDALVLVQMADTLADQQVLQEILNQQEPRLAAVEEQSENQAFERIDLNSRWAGLALLQRRNLAGLTSLPDGWDMGSALLRQALQDGVARWPVAQRHIQSGAVKKLRVGKDLAKTLDSSHLLQDNAANTLEKIIFVPAVKMLTPHLWLTSWSRPLVEWLFPALATLSAILSWLAYPLTASAMVLAAIFAALLRKQARALEYRSGESDWLGMLGWCLLAITLGAALYHAELSRADGMFVCLSLLGLSAFARNYWQPGKFWLSSPLVIALIVIFGHGIGESGWAVRLLILAELVLLVLSRFRASGNDQVATERA